MSPGWKRSAACFPRYRRRFQGSKSTPRQAFGKAGMPGVPRWPSKDTLILSKEVTLSLRSYGSEGMSTTHPPLARLEPRCLGDERFWSTWKDKGVQMEKTQYIYIYICVSLYIYIYVYIYIMTLWYGLKLAILWPSWGGWAKFSIHLAPRLRRCGAESGELFGGGSSEWSSAKRCEAKSSSIFTRDYDDFFAVIKKSEWWHPDDENFREWWWYKQPHWKCQLWPSGSMIIIHTPELMAFDLDNSLRFTIMPLPGWFSSEVAIQLTQNHGSFFGVPKSHSTNNSGPSYEASWLLARLPLGR